MSRREAGVEEGAGEVGFVEGEGVGRARRVRPVAGFGLARRDIPLEDVDRVENRSAPAR